MTSKDTDTPQAAPAGAADKPSKAKKAKAPAAVAEPTAPAAAVPTKERIAKAMARAGLCSRREAEEWIAAGRVAVNGAVLTSPAVTVGADDRVVVDGVPMPMRERTRLWLYHKPRGLITTTADPEGRDTVFDHLPPDLPRVVSVGRLDINTEGLLLLTNDGGLARVLELPSTGWLRRYRVRAFGPVDEAALAKLRDGLVVEGVEYGPIEAEIERRQGGNTWLVIGLREGKNREIKRVLGSLGLSVNRLIRVSFGPFQLAELAEGEVREIRGRVLKDQLGARLVAESGADFDAPFLTHVGPEEAAKRAKQAAKRGEPGGKGGKPERPARTKLEYAGSGERTRTDRARAAAAGEAGERPAKRGLRSEGFRSQEGRGRAGGFRDRPDAEGGRPRPVGARSERPPRAERAEGDARPPRSGGFRDRPEGGERPHRPRTEGDARPPRSGGFRDRPEGQGERPRRPRPEGDSRPPRSGGFRDRPEGQGERPRRPRPEGDTRPPRSGGFRDRPEEQGERPRRPRPEGDTRPPRSGGFRDRPEGQGERPRRPRPEGDTRPPRADRAEGDRPRGPRPDRPPRAGGFRDRPEGGAPLKRRPRLFSDTGEDLGEYRPSRDDAPRRGDKPPRDGAGGKTAGPGRPGGKTGGKPGGKPGGGRGADRRR